MFKVVAEVEFEVPDAVTGEYEAEDGRNEISAPLVFDPGGQGAPSCRETNRRWRFGH